MRVLDQPSKLVTNVAVNTDPTRVKLTETAPDGRQWQAWGGTYAAAHAELGKLVNGAGYTLVE